MITEKNPIMNGKKMGYHYCTKVWNKLDISLFLKVSSHQDCIYLIKNTVR